LAKALGITVFDQKVAWGTLQKGVEFCGGASDRQVQAICGKYHSGARPFEAKIRGEHHDIVIDVLRLGAAQFNAKNGYPPAAEPARNAVYDHPEGEVGERPGCGVLIIEHDLRHTLLAEQTGIVAFKHQAKESQRARKPISQCWLRHGRFAEKFKAAPAQRARIHTEEQVIAGLFKALPQCRVLAYANTRIGSNGNVTLNACLGQQHALCVLAQSAFEQSFMYQRYGNGVFQRPGDECRHILMFRHSRLVSLQALQHKPEPAKNEYPGLTGV
jgi:hypothetical protein